MKMKMIWSLDLMNVTNHSYHWISLWFEDWWQIIWGQTAISCMLWCSEANYSCLLPNWCWHESRRRLSECVFIPFMRPVGQSENDSAVVASVVSPTCKPQRESSSRSGTLPHSPAPCLWSRLGPEAAEGSWGKACRGQHQFNRTWKRRELKSFDGSTKVFCQQTPNPGLSSHLPRVQR